MRTRRKVNDTLALALLLVAALLAGIAVAGDRHEKRIEVIVADDEADAPLALRLDQEHRIVIRRKIESTQSD
ncbi:MAG: hypothetical protein P8172_10005 [Gammaproteobacteria bacterium]|jgi:hypothetical protein